MGKFLVTTIFAFALVVFTAAIVLPLRSTGLLAQELRKQESAPFNAVEAHQAIEKLAAQLEENFIYPKVGKAYADMLRSKITSGAYSKFSSAEEFAKIVTADLQAVHPEGHLKLQPPIVNSGGTPSVATAKDINGVGKSGWLAPGVAYMSFHGFSGNREEYQKVLKELREVLEGFSTAKTLIIDALKWSNKS
jgi:hypothetical protein